MAKEIQRTTMKAIITWILATLIAVGTLGAMATPYNPITVVSNQKMLAMRVDQHIINDNIAALQRQILELELWYKKNPPMPEPVKKQIFELQEQKRRLELRLQRGNG